MADKCRWYWGSHGCDRLPGHAGLHVCEDCSEFDAVNQRARFSYGDGSWSPWNAMTGWEQDG